MARPIKNTVEYFPHFAKAGRTVFILETKFGNDGYAFWFKLLELLCDSDRQMFDCSQPSNWQYLLARTRCDGEQAEAIIAELINLGKIDAPLWQEKRVIWVQNLVNNLEPIYRKRRETAPTRDSFGGGNPDKQELSARKLDVNPVSDAETSQRKGKESKEEESKEKESKVVVPYAAVIELWNSVCTAYPKVVKLTDSRRTKIKLRLGEFSGDPEQWLPLTRQLFDRVQASNFLHGDNRNGWSATFDWLFENSGNWVKVMEGNYDNKGGYRPVQQRVTTASGVTLGVGEYIDETGRRTYGTGRATIPADAPARPSDRYSWDAGSKTWVML